MKMTEEVERLTVDDDEVTLVAPRFDEEETLVARRVVPLEAVGGAARAATRAAAPVPARQPRRSRVLALAFASALGGGVLGGAGLYLYQSRASSNPSPAAKASERADAPAEVAQPEQAAPQPSPAADALNDSRRPAGQQHDAAAGGGESQAAPHAVESKAEDGAGARKRGKKGGHDEETQRPRSRAKSADSDQQLSRDDDDAPGARAPRRADAIFERPRRAAERDRARRERSHPVDSIRGIFEGQPQ